MLFGSSSLDLFPFCRERGIFLFVNQRLHLKTALVDFDLVMTGSANLTERGLGLTDQANFETMVTMPSTHAYLVYLRAIRNEAKLMTDELYRVFQATVARVDAVRSLTDLDALTHEQSQLDVLLEKRDFFLVSELPLTRIDDLYAVVTGQPRDADVLATARHDIAMYGLHSLDLTDRRRFDAVLTERFFAHPFIAALCRFIDRPQRFGALKEWVQRNCTDVPIPSRRELTENVQILFDWLEYLGADKFRVSRPRHTQIIQPM